MLKGKRFSFKLLLLQISKSEITVYWEKFTDIEEIGHRVYESGISHYKVAIGKLVIEG